MDSGLSSAGQAATEMNGFICTAMANGSRTQPASGNHLQRADLQRYFVFSAAMFRISLGLQGFSFPV